jgi:nicotinamidase-related amidase
MTAHQSAPTLSVESTVVLLLDHQVGLVDMLDEEDPQRIRENVVALARTARLLQMPVLVSTSRDWGPNGELLPELADLLSGVEVFRRPGFVNAYRWPAFRQALEATGRRRVVIAALTDGTCPPFPALDLVDDGYDVHAVTDASGAELPQHVMRGPVTDMLADAGVQMKSWFTVATELISGWGSTPTRTPALMP